MVCLRVWKEPVSDPECICNQARNVNDLEANISHGIVHGEKTSIQRLALEDFPLRRLRWWKVVPKVIGGEVSYTILLEFY